ncbi:MAG: polysaccharide pyruvyl transferase family protein [Candidatus Gastranaerophilales bacterium]|nr:polysaccharide pyruvyl transferase family protein [Candidatus Gastranaerophilales bacterium]
MKNNVGICNYWWIRNNYGALLTAYALKVFLIKNDMSPFFIDDLDFVHRFIFRKLTFSKIFQTNNLKPAQKIKKYDDLYKLNKDCEIFITGSDQVFRAARLHSEERLKQYLLEFAGINSKKISFSASFGVSKEEFLKETSPQLIQEMKHYLKAFNSISVREFSGVDICREIFGIEAQWIIDPVFLLEKSDYETLICNTDSESKDKIVSYVLDSNNDYNKAYNYLSDKFNTDVLELAHTNLSVEKWLASINDCKLLLTDSFHGICYAIIFNKPFICINNKDRGCERFNSIFKMLNINVNSINHINQIYEQDAISYPNYQDVNKCIQNEKQKAIIFFNNAINSDKDIEERKTLTKLKHKENRIFNLKKHKTTIKNFLWNIWVLIFYSLPNSLQTAIRRKR